MAVSARTADGRSARSVNERARGTLGGAATCAGVLPLSARTADGRSARSVNERARGTLGGAATCAVFSLCAHRGRGAPSDPLTSELVGPLGEQRPVRAFYLSLRAPRTGAPPDPLTSELVGPLGEQRPVAGVLPLSARTADGAVPARRTQGASPHRGDRSCYYIQNIDHLSSGYPATCLARGS